MTSAGSDAGAAGPVTTIVLAAGEGTRMRSATPKVLHPLAGRSLVGHAVRAVAGVRPDHLTVVVGHGREQVAEHLAALSGSLGRQITTAVQHDQLGTGHAVSCALAALPTATEPGTVLVSYGDVPLLDTPTIEGLLAEHANTGNAATVLTSVVVDPTGYGRILRDGTAVTGIVEQRDATADQLEIAEINSGVYAFDADVLRIALAQLSTSNAQGELYLTDVLGIARELGRAVGALVCDDPWLVEGVNDRAQLAALGAECNRRLTRAAMLGGATVTDPGTVWLDAGVRLGRDVLVEPNVQLRGDTVVEDGARVGPDSTLDSVHVGAGATVVRTHGSDATVGAGASVGPFAYLRPGTVLGDGGKIGTFVETKNARIGAGSKVPHLSYIGDATIGERSNIGAASVVVNYDGVAKHHTVIGSDVRMGSDNMYVAPVTVGDGAYSGAGAVLREDVPPGALAVSGGPQRNLEGWVLAKRPGTAAAEAAEKAQQDGNPVADQEGGQP